MSAAVCVRPPDARVDERLAETILALRPTLGEHACKLNGIGRFSDKITGTTLPHLLEHVTIDILVERALLATDGSAGGITPISGNTRRYDSDSAVMIVTISSTNLDHNAAADALADAIALINRLIES